MISKQQIEEWTENPVTLAFLKLARDEQQSLQVGTDAYHPFEPHKTQEIFANLNGGIDVWDYVIATLEGSGLFMEEEDSEDRDHPEWE